MEQFLHENGYTVPSSYAENRNKFFKPSPGNNVSSHHSMIKSDLTPEEQETTRKSKDPSVIMTAHGLFIRVKKQQYMSMIWTRLFK